jgi:protein-S-isoprenylcysteine O-methyltransferase Ste14
MNVSRSTPRVRAMTAAILACAVLVAVSSRPWLAGNGVASGLAGFAGFALVVIAALGRLWTSLFIAGYKDDSLVQDGPYATCRHPLYLLTLVGALGLGLATRSLTLACGLLAFTALLHARALRAEDANLVRRHGEAARHYQSQVPALWPDFARCRVPDMARIRPRLVWKAVLDAGSLLLAFALVQAAHALQSSGVTPAWLRLP